MISNKVYIRQIKESDSVVISDAFTAQGWNKPKKKYDTYLEEQTAGRRDVLIAEINGEFAGYLTIDWDAAYPPFREAKIPEIVDFNVLIKYRRKGIGTALMDEAENRVSKRSDIAGIGFGLTDDYGNAQIMYVKRGYVPDGKGVSQRGSFLKYGNEVTVDDDLALYLTKQLSNGTPRRRNTGEQKKGRIE